MRRLLIILSLFPLLLNAQEERDTLGFGVYSLSFFRDNEYDSEITKGYTLPGTRLRPYLTYDVNSLWKDNDSNGKRVHMELGAEALIFDGANKYPCYAYHDIGHWKGNQYQSGAHVLPWARIEAQIGSWGVVLGDIYGGEAHGYSTPLYNNEQTLSADPEAGAQILYHTAHINSEAYVNWQSYQFEEDTHQEAFTVGVNFCYTTDELPGHGRLSFPVNILAQHRGGEQDISSLQLGVQTIANAAVGVNYQQTLLHSCVDHWKVGVNILGCYQQAGKLWPFDSGLAYNAEGELQLCKHFNVKVGDFYAPDSFVSIYGNPFFSTLSTKTDINHPGLNTAYLMGEYSYNVARNCVLSANAEIFKVNSTNLSEVNFSFGLYLRVNPWFNFKK